MPGKFQMEGTSRAKALCWGRGVADEVGEDNSVDGVPRGLVWGEAGEGRQSRPGLWEWGLDPKSIAGMRHGQSCVCR